MKLIAKTQNELNSSILGKKHILYQMRAQLNM